MRSPARWLLSAVVAFAFAILGGGLLLLAAAFVPPIAAVLFFVGAPFVRILEHLAPRLVQAHTELAWAAICVTVLSWLGLTIFFATRVHSEPVERQQ